jgi:hypothetical protein
VLQLAPFIPRVPDYPLTRAVISSHSLPPREHAEHT